MQQRRNDEREQALRRQLEARPDVNLQADPAPSQQQLPAHEAPCFVIRAIRWKGEPTLPGGWQEWLDAALAGNKLGDGPLQRCIGASGVRVLQSRAQQMLVARGYTTSRVLIEPQDLATGELQFTVMPGRIHAIRLDAPAQARVTLHTALPAREGDVLNVRDFEQALETIGRAPGTEVGIDIEPARPSRPDDAPVAPGQSDVVIRVRPAFPVRLSLTVDDGGTRATGREQVSATVAFDSPLGLSDLFYVTLNRSLAAGEHGTRGNTVHYEVPWGYWLAGVTAGRYRYHQSVAGATQAYMYSGDSSTSEFALSRVAGRDASGKAVVTAKAWQRTSRNFIDDTEVQVQRRTEAGWELGVAASRGIGASHVDAHAAYRRGTGAFGALAAPEDAFGEGSSRFGIGLADAAVNLPWQAAGQRLRYVAEWRAQASNAPLTPLDRFAIGGRYTVRGFDWERQLSAEHGWLWRNEVALAWGPGASQELYAAVDHGEVGGPSARLLSGTRLTGAALGVRGVVLGVHYDVFAGAPLDKPHGFETSTWTAGFALSWSL